MLRRALRLFFFCSTVLSIYSPAQAPAKSSSPLSTQILGCWRAYDKANRPSDSSMEFNPGGVWVWRQRVTGGNISVEKQTWSVEKGIVHLDGRDPGWRITLKGDKFEQTLNGVSRAEYFQLWVRVPSSNCVPVGDRDTDAHEQAQWFVVHRYENCNGDFFTRIYKDIYQIKDLKWYISWQPITDIDRLNGIEHKGTVTLTASASRKLNHPVGGATPWGKGFGTPFEGRPRIIQKQKGKWTLYPGPMDEFRAIPCEEVQPYLKKAP